MRHTRWLFLAAIVSILVFVGGTYVKNKAELARHVLPPPKPLATGLDGAADDWTYTKYDGDRKKVFVRAKEWKKIKEPSLLELSGVELQLYHPDGMKFDLVKSDKVLFDVDAKTLYSDGDTDITMGVVEGAPPAGRLLRIQSSGVHFDSDTGKATTDRVANFEFDRGRGSAVGADYDPGTHEVHLHTMVALDWGAKTPEGKPMHAEAGEAIYHEIGSTVMLFPWSKLIRGTLVMDAGVSYVRLDMGVIRAATLKMARGVQDDPDRKVEYSADTLDMDFADGMVIQKIHGEKNAHLVSTAKTTRTAMDSERLDLDFAVADKESTLTKAVATGHSKVEATPLEKPGTPLADTRILNSDTIRLAMRPGGQYIDKVETDGPGTLDFIPNRPDQPKRHLTGDRIWIAYGEANRIQSFRSVNATTSTEKPATPPKAGQPAKPAPPPTVTKSKDILAIFDPTTSELAKLDQSGNFRYDAGDRHAQSDHATLDQAKDLITLVGSANGQARAQDESGSITADQIVMSQKSEDYQADGNVKSVRQPDRKGASSAMLSNDEVMQGAADKMITSGGNKKIHYEGNARAWQASNRVTADKIDIDRESRVMEAHGKVVSEFTDKDKDKDKDPGKDKENDKQGKAKAPSAPLFTVVHASDLVYTEETRIALYQGAVHLERPGSNLVVDSQKLQAFLKSSDSDSSLDKAFADGDVKIVSIVMPSPNAKPAKGKNGKQKSNEKRVRTGTSEHAEYYVDDQKVLLRGGRPVMDDSVKGRSAGDELTLFVNDDTLQVHGNEGQQAETTIRKQ
jgi:lipopolysaccharide export system protein LptA